MATNPRIYQRESEIRQPAVSRQPNDQPAPPPPPGDVALRQEQQRQAALVQEQHLAGQQPVNATPGTGTPADASLHDEARKLGKVLVSRRTELTLRWLLIILFVALAVIVAGGLVINQVTYLNYGYPREHRFSARLNLKVYKQLPDGSDPISEVRVKNNNGNIQVQVDAAGVISGGLITKPFFIGQNEAATAVKGHICQESGANYPQIEVVINDRSQFVVNDGRSIRWAKEDEQAVLGRTCTRRPELEVHR